MTLKLLKELNPYAQLERASAKLESGLREVASEAGIVATTNLVGSMMTAFFTDETVVDWTTAKKSNTESYAQFFRASRRHSIN